MLHAASLPIPAATGERTLLEEMMAEAVQANKEKEALKRKEALSAASTFGAGLSGGFLGASSPPSPAPAPAAVPGPARPLRCDNPTCGKLEREVRAAGGKFAKCGKCKVVWYCTPDCQRAHWSNGHRQQCGKVCVYV